MVKIMQALGQLDVGYKANSPASGLCGLVQLASCVLSLCFFAHKMDCCRGKMRGCLYASLLRACGEECCVSSSCDLVWQRL